MWHYAIGDRKLGPVSEEELATLAAGGQINRETLVWRKGMAEWKALSDTELALRITEIAPGPPIEASGPPVARPDWEPSSMDTLFRNWAILSGVAAALSILMEVLAGTIAGSSPGAGALGVFGLAGLVIIVSLGVLVALAMMFHRAWQVLQDGQASMTPLSVLLLLLIPCVNAVGVFVVYFRYPGAVDGFAKRWGLKLSPPPLNLCILRAVLTIVGLAIAFTSMGRAAGGAGLAGLVVSLTIFALDWVILRAVRDTTKSIATTLRGRVTDPPLPHLG